MLFTKPVTREYNATVWYGVNSPGSDNVTSSGCSTTLTTSTVGGPAGAAFSLVWAGALPRHPVIASNEITPTAARTRSTGVCILIRLPAGDRRSLDRLDPLTGIQYAPTAAPVNRPMAGRPG